MADPYRYGVARKLPRDAIVSVIHLLGVRGGGSVTASTVARRLPTNCSGTSTGASPMTDTPDYHTPDHVIEYLARQVGVEPERLREGEA